MNDLQTKEKFYFLCNNWLALEYGDGKIERRLFVASDKDKTKLEYLIKKQATTYLYDNHMWLSIFKKPILSPLTRLDRVTCCFVFHYLTMLLNILYYNSSLDLLPSSIEINFAIFNITIEQVMKFFLNFFIFMKIFIPHF